MDIFILENSGSDDSAAEEALISKPAKPKTKRREKRKKQSSSSDESEDIVIDDEADIRNKPSDSDRNLRTNPRKTFRLSDSEDSGTPSSKGSMVLKTQPPVRKRSVPEAKTQLPEKRSSVPEEIPGRSTSVTSGAEVVITLESAIAKIKGVQSIDPVFAETILRHLIDFSMDVKWDDIIGQTSAKEALLEAVLWPSKQPKLFKGITAPPRGILLYGPPGNGKTMLAKAIATESKHTFFSISASSIMSKWTGESEKLVQTQFACAKELQPSVIFVDKIDSVLCARKEDESDHTRRIKTEFLVGMDGVSSKPDDRVLLIGATNLPNELDVAALRRFPKRIMVKMPETVARIDILRKLLKDRAGSLRDEDYRDAAAMCKGYSGSDLAALAKEAAMRPVREICRKQELAILNLAQIRSVDKRDLKEAMKCIRPSVPEKTLEKLDQWTSKYGTL